MSFDWQVQVFKIPLIGNACSLATLNMRRVHAFEYNDLSWFPINFRNAATDFLQFAANKLDLYKNILPVIEKGVQSSGNNTIVDTASEGGGLVKIAEHLNSRIPNLKIMLTDYYPNVDAFKRTPNYSSKRVYSVSMKEMNCLIH